MTAPFDIIKIIMGKYIFVQKNHSREAQKNGK